MSPTPQSCKTLKTIGTFRSRSIVYHISVCDLPEAKDKLTNNTTEKEGISPAHFDVCSKRGRRYTMEKSEIHTLNTCLEGGLQAPVPQEVVKARARCANYNNLSPARQNQRVIPDCKVWGDLHGRTVSTRADGTFEGFLKHFTSLADTETRVLQRNTQRLFKRLIHISTEEKKCRRGKRSR